MDDLRDQIAQESLLLDEDEFLFEDEDLDFDI